MVPVFKKNGNEEDPASYRPICVLSVISKLFERSIYHQIYNMFSDQLPSSQHAFRRNHSTLTALLEVTEDSYKALDMKRTAYIVQLDIQKAYDTVNPHILLQNIIDSVNPSEPLQRLFEQYLCGRHIASFSRNTLSTFKETSIGVPQGAVLSPLLFIYLFRYCMIQHSEKKK